MPTSSVSSISLLLSLILSLDWFRSDLYSLSLERHTALALGCKLLASRSIFRIYKKTTEAYILILKKKEQNGNNIKAS
jgi:hypothetical protein